MSFLKFIEGLIKNDIKEMIRNCPDFEKLLEVKK